MPGPAFVAAVIAAGSGWGVLRHGRRLTHEGTSLADGGGWTALILAETMISLGAAAFAVG